MNDKRNAGNALVGHGLFFTGILMIFGKFYLPQFGVSGSFLVVELVVSSFVLFCGLIDELIATFGISFAGAFVVSNIVTLIVLAVVVLA